jgi:RNA polymerase sigma-70 factor (ECF subfamily)
MNDSAVRPTSGLDNGLDEAIARAKAGDRAALEEVLASVAPAIHRFGLRMCRTAHDADDVLQDTLVSVTKHLAEFEGRSSLTSWVFTLARTACSRRRRGLKNAPALSDDALVSSADGAPSPEARAADQELVTALSAALDSLTDDYREVILLRDVEGLSAPEAAAALGISVDALKSRLHRAREALRTALRPVLEGPVVEGATVARPVRGPTAPAPSVGGCPDIIGAWSKKLEGDLSPNDCAAMEKHIETCPACGSACHALKQALWACQRIRTTEVPPAIQARIKEAVRSWAGPGVM